MNDQILQAHLNLKHMSRRGVRLRLLTYAETQKCENSAASLVGDGTFAEFRNAVFHEGVLRMISAVTEPVDEITEKTKWTPVTFQQLSDPMGDLSANKLFGARDLNLLEALYRDYHEVTQDEVDIVVGKGKPTPKAKPGGPRSSGE